MRPRTQPSSTRQPQAWSAQRCNTALPGECYRPPVRRINHVEALRAVRSLNRGHRPRTDVATLRSGGATSFDIQMPDIVAFRFDPAEPSIAMGLGATRAISTRNLRSSPDARIQNEVSEKTNHDPSTNRKGK